MSRAILVLLVLALASCTNRGVSYDKEVDDLGAHIISDLKALPTVSEAAYHYDHGVDLGQHLRVRAILRQASTAPADIQQAIDLAAKEFWLSPAAVGHLTVAVYSSANPPVGDDDAKNRDRAIGFDNIEDSAAFDRPEMEKRYGPRPTRR